MDEDRITSEEAALLLEVTTRTVQRYVKQGMLTRQALEGGRAWYGRADQY
jgi:predicted site-specific integrase-resolvase